MTRVLHAIAFVGTALVVSSCGLIPKSPPIVQYRLVLPQTDDGTSAAPLPPVLTGTLSISSYRTPGIYDERRIVFRVDDHQLAQYPAREWAIPLRDMLGALTEEALSMAPLSVEPAEFDEHATPSRDYHWRGSVREFEEVNRGRQVLAAVHLDVEIIRNANDSVVWRGSERLERAVPPPTNSMTRVVETLSALTGDVLSRLIARARSDLGVPTTAAASAPPPP